MAERWLPASVSPPIPTAKIVGLALPIPSASVFYSFNIKKGMKDKKNGYFCFHLHKSSHCRVTEGGSVDGLSAKDR